MKNKKRTRVGSEEQYGPRIAGEILHDYLENSNEPMAVAYREHKTAEKGWHANTDLDCNLKTLLRSDKRAKAGKSYLGLLRLDSDTFVDEYLSRDPHYTFVETLPNSAGKRNPRIFDGRYLTVTRRDDGKLRPNFKPMPKIDKDFNLEQYALGVFNELCIGLGGLVEEE